NVIGNGLDQLEMSISQRFGAGELQVHVILAGLERGFGIVVRDRLERNRDRKAQGLGPAGFLREDPGVDHVLEVGEFEGEAVGHLIFQLQTAPMAAARAIVHRHEATLEPLRMTRTSPSSLARACGALTMATLLGGCVAAVAVPVLTAVGAATEKRRSRAEVVADLPAANAASLAATPDLNADTAVQLTTLTELPPPSRSEEHTSELQSRENLVCRLLLEKKKKEN